MRHPKQTEKSSRNDPTSLGDILKDVVRKARPRRKLLEGRRLAQKILLENLPETLTAHAGVISVKTGVVTIETDSSAAFQEIEGYNRGKLLAAFRQGGLQVREVRVKMGA